MKQPELVITSKPEYDFLAGECSACPKIKFSLTGNTLEHKQLLQTMFDKHCRRVHSKEDTSQAAA
jgi:hypothetical protein